MDAAASIQDECGVLTCTFIGPAHVIPSRQRVNSDYGAFAGAVEKQTLLRQQ